MPAAIPFVIAAGQAYAAATAATTLVAGLYASAAAFTTIGALAKNEKLQMLGSLLGVGGSVAGAVGQSSAATAADAVREAETPAAAATPEATSAPAETADLASPAAEAVTPPAAADLPANAIGGQPGQEGILQGAAAPAAAETPLGTGGGIISEQAGMQPQTAGASPIASWNDVRGPSGWGSPSASAPAPGAGDWWGDLKQSVSGLGDWVEKNPASAKMVGGLIQGGMQYAGQQRIADDNLKRQQRYQDWVRQRYSDSVRALQVPAVSLTTPSSSGIIGGQRG